MKKKHETSTINGFFDRFKSIAGKHGRELTRCSTDGQDSILGADYVFTNNTKFVLTEFKYEENDLHSEKIKSRRLRLCKLLDKDAVRLRQSLKCHYIAWSVKKHTRTIQFNKYYHEICNAAVFGNNSNLLNDTPDYKERISADSLIEDFLSDQIGANYKLFEVYTNWLLDIEGKSGDGIELMLNNPDSDQLELLDFNSVRELKIWLDQNKPKPRPGRSSPGSGFGRG